MELQLLERNTFSGSISASKKCRTITVTCMVCFNPRCQAPSQIFDSVSKEKEGEKSNLAKTRAEVENKILL